MQWAYGVTAVQERLDNGALPRTLASLAAAGFEAPRLFADGVGPQRADWERLGYPLTLRFPKVRLAVSWFMALVELHSRQPLADRYAIFQDDILAAKNLRRYLERVPWQKNTYLNLCLYPQNAELAGARLQGRRSGFFPANGPGWSGKGAQGLVFDRAACRALLTSQYMVTRQDDTPARNYRFIDGGISCALGGLGYRELAHMPSLVAHQEGLPSTTGNPRQPTTAAWDPNLDALTLGV